MKNLLFCLCMITLSLTAAAGIPPLNDINYYMIDNGISATLSASGVIQQVNTQKAFSIGIEVIITTSGTVTSPTATMQGSIDCVNYFNLPVASSGDSRVTASVGTGTYYFEKPELNVNCIQMYYSYTGSGTMTIKELKKMHDALH